MMGIVGAGVFTKYLLRPNEELPGKPVLRLSCREVFNRLDAYALSEIENEEVIRAIEAHLAKCLGCRMKLDQLLHG